VPTISRSVAATDSFFALIGAHQRGTAVGLMTGENPRFITLTAEVSAKQSIKRQLHTTHVGAVDWEPHSSSTTTCAGKVDHELPVHQSKGHTPTHGLTITSLMRTAISRGQWQPWTEVSPILGLISIAVNQRPGKTRVQGPFLQRRVL